MQQRAVSISLNVAENVADLKVIAKLHKTFSQIKLGSMSFKLGLAIIAALLACGNAAPQDISNVDKNIQDIFNTNPGPSQPSQPSGPTGGFQVVTPVPIDPTSPVINFNSVSGKQANCNCVPYYMCDPSTNSITEDGSFDGFGVIDIRFGEDDPVCPSSVDVCCAGNRTRTEVLNPTPLDQRPNQARGCGIRNLGGLDFTLSGATQNEAGFGEFPWTVALLHAGNSSYFCGGSLIHPQVVLTAVHCLLPHAPGTFVARAGEWDAQTTKERLPFQERAVQRVITHPQYNVRNVANDFALVILTQEFTLDDHINVVCLPDQGASPAARTTCFSTGWGKDVFGAAGKRSCDARDSDLNSAWIAPSCARADNEASTPVKAMEVLHSLAPLDIATENRYQQSGIVAWGIGCNDEVPAAYANVALARTWIDQQMLANGFGTGSYST
ncbi:hypothetical protein ACLKA6_000115 [Drosophila palustris]